MNELRRLKQLEEENFKLKQMVADLSLDKQCFRTFKKTLRPAQTTKLAQNLLDDYRVSERRACRVVLLSHSTWTYHAVRQRSDGPLALRIREVAETRVRYGMWSTYVLLRREGWKDNHKRVHRIYKAEGLNLGSKRPRSSRAAAHAWIGTLLNLCTRSLLGFSSQNLIFPIV